MILLRIMRRRSDYNKLKDMIPASNLDPQAVAIIEDFGKYFEKFPTHTSVDMTTFLPRFKAWHPKMSDEKFNSFRAMLLNTVPEPDEDQRKNILAELSELELMTKLANLTEEFNQGDLPDAYDAVNRTMDAFRERTGRRASSYVETPIGELLQDEFDDTGIAWRLDCLNMSMRKLRPGDFGIIAGRPDKGKTSFISSEVTFFAKQLPPDRNVVWLNNEGKGARIKPRWYQSALNLTMNELKERYREGVLVDQYREAIGGRLDKLRVYDIHGFSTGQVESILEESNPGVIVYDMIDKIRGFGDAARTDLMLEQMYDWARERSVKYDCIGLATSQISNEGDGLQFPTLGMLKDSKTGKQGACDFQLMIGASNDVVLAGSRFISLPKNKLRRPDGAADPRAEVIFDGLRARYRDIPVGT